MSSQTGTGYYRVTLYGLFPTCSCEDHELTGGECKHILAAKLWRAEQRANPNTEPQPPAAPPEWPERKTYRQDWRRGSGNVEVSARAEAA